MCFNYFLKNFSAWMAQVIAFRCLDPRRHSSNQTSQERKIVFNKSIYIPLVFNAMADHVFIPLGNTIQKEAAKQTYLVCVQSLC
jgi:hypothetical protein